MNAGPLIFLVLMIAVLWLVLIRPQRQRQAAHRRLVEELRPGEEVVTLGGIFGRVKAIEDDRIELEIAPGTEIKVAKQAVTGVLRNDEETPSETQDPG